MCGLKYHGPPSLTQLVQASWSTWILHSNKNITVRVRTNELPVHLREMEKVTGRKIWWIPALACWSTVFSHHLFLRCSVCISLRYCRSADKRKRWPWVRLDRAAQPYPFNFTLFTHQQWTCRLDTGPDRRRRMTEGREGEDRKEVVTTQNEENSDFPVKSSGYEFLL